MTTQDTPPQVQCALCKDRFDPEQPFDTGYYGVNPQTHREAWMHSTCFQDARDDLTPDEREKYEQAILRKENQ